MSSVLQQIHMNQGTHVLMLELQAALPPGPGYQVGMLLHMILRQLLKRILGAQHT